VPNKIQQDGADDGMLAAGGGGGKGKEAEKLTPTNEGKCTFVCV